LTGGFEPVAVAAVFAGLAVIGVLICGIAAFFASNKYIRANYDDLFKK
jgi:type IV secretory pathway VirB2 component (pilin)